jgi:hypothetical protein
MKVVIQIGMGRMGEGIASSLVIIPQLSVSFWDNASKPVMDMFDEIKPDLVFVNSDMLKQEDIKIASQRYQSTPIISIGDIVDNITNPILSINNNNKKSGIPNIPFEGGVMLGKIGRPQYEDRLSCDILCLTDHLNKDEGKTNILQFVSSSYNAKIFGRTNFAIPSYLGIISDQQRANAIQSAKILLDLDGETQYDAMWLGKHVVNSFSSILDLKRSIDEALGKGENTLGKIKVKNKTYFDLCSQLLSFLGLPQQAKFLDDKKGEVL